MTTHPHYFTEQDVADFNRPLQELSKKLAAKQDRPPKVRHTSEILAEVERAPLGLRAVEHRLRRVEQALASARAKFEKGTARLAELKAASWYTPHLPQVKNLVGYERNDRGATSRVKGLIEVAEEDVARLERDVPAIKAQRAAESKSLAKRLKALNAELAEVRPAEDAANGVTRRGHLLTKAEPSGYDQRMAETGF